MLIPPVGSTGPDSCAICGSRNVRRLCDKAPARYYICRSCSLIFQHPLPTRLEMQDYADAQYTSGLYLDYVQARTMKLAHFNARINEILPYVKPGRLLDVGCSCGYFMEVAAQHGFDVSGLEFSQSAVAAAAPHISNRIQQASLEDVVSTISAFDVVTAFDLIEHVHDPVKFARNAGEILKPGGILALSTPDA